MKKKLRKYYYKMDKWEGLEEWCKVKDNGTMIGSYNCSRCKNCIKYLKKSIICKVINKATGKEK